jgi:ABC-2 type transport system permease protein
MASPAPARSRARGDLAKRLRHNVRILHVIAAMDFKLKYADSGLGYVWSVAKPLALFTMLYLVFGRVFKLGSISPYYPLALLIGIVIYTFFSESTSLGMFSIVERGDLLRKMSFPRLIVPASRTISVAITFGVNLTVVAVFIAWNGIQPQWTWLLLVPLLLELYVFTLGVALLLAALFVRLRDIGQVWELWLTLLFYATPILYPVGFLPPWAQTLAFISPLTQVLQDVRALVLYDELAPNRITASEVFHSSAGRLIPVGVAVATLLLGLAFFRRESPMFAERI